MSNPRKWIDRQVHLAWFLLAAGLTTGLLGFVLPWLLDDLPFNPRIITGVGILLVAWGIAHLVRYSALRRDAQAARRAISEERDERMLHLRARAGNRAYWVSAGLTYAGLMWLSFAENGDLPTPSPDTLWYFLVVLVILPFGVYAASLAYDQRHH